MKYTHLLSCFCISALLFACKAPSDAEIQQKINRLEAPAAIDYGESNISRSKRSVSVSRSSRLDLVDDAYLDSAPQRYVVKKGDTLWGIAKRFLKSPAYWSHIWHANPKIKNPNAIYPGDVISYVMKEGQRKLQIAGSSSAQRSKYTGKRSRNGLPIYKLSPTVKEERLEESIPVLPKEMIHQFTAKSIVINGGDLANTPYILEQPNAENLSLTLENTLFAKGDTFEEQEYDLYRVGKQLTGADGQDLGYFARYVGSASLNEVLENDVATLNRTDAYYVIEAGDVLLPKKAINYGQNLDYMPRLSNLDVDASIVKSVESDSKNASQFATVLIDKGLDDGVSQGDVFKIVNQHQSYAQSREGESIALPDETIGIGMIYKVFDQSSYVIILEANKVISEGDRLISP